MLLYEKVLKDTEGRSRLFNIYNCDSCGKEYKKQARFSGSKQEHYCSSGCYSNATTKIKVGCSHCGIEFYKQKSKLANSKSGLYFCCREHKDLGQRYIKEIQPDHYNTGESNYRARALKYYGHECSVCGFDNIAALEVHHKDRDRTNNHLDNLEVLCANCHKIEHLGEPYGTAS